MAFLDPVLSGRFHEKARKAGGTLPARRRGSTFCVHRYEQGLRALSVPRGRRPFSNTLCLLLVRDILTVPPLSMYYLVRV